MRDSPWRRQSRTEADSKAEVEWYGKPAKKAVVVTGDPVLCYIVGGTCFAEIESVNELAAACGKNVTIGGSEEER